MQYVLQEYQHQVQPVPKDALIVVTGRGLHTTEATITQIKPALLDMLAGPRFADLSATVHPTNSGCLIIPREKLAAWVKSSL